MTLPQITYLEAQLHNIPDKLRSSVQGIIDRFEDEHPEPSIVQLGFGLCGRGLCGVTARHATLVFPRVHDCISVLLGQEHNKENAITREGAIYWCSPGHLECFQINLHLHPKERLAMFEEKFGLKKAARLLRAEQALFRNYHCLGHILWPEMQGRYDRTAREVADAVGIPYEMYPGNSSFLRELVAGGRDTRRFLRLRPGQTLDMDLEGNIIAVPAAASPP